jgi:CheY-like chemotaxis protein
MNKELFNVLVVEDDFFVKEEIKKVVTELGHTVIGDAANGKEGIEKAIELSPDIILMDIGMSVMGGIEAAKIISEKKPTPIVFLTAHESMDMVELATEAGASAYLTKPPTPSELDRAFMVATARHSDVMSLRKLNKSLEDKNRELETALSEIRELRDLIPICCYCKKVRDDKGYWESVDSYLTKVTGSNLSHGICPDCFPKVIKDI